MGDGVNLTQDVVISCERSISIGDNTLIGEFVSIRDSNHGIDPSRDIREQEPTSSPVTIGRDVWLGRGVFVGPGVSIGDGAVIGANSVVLRSIPSFSIAAGAPARVIGERRTTDRNAAHS